MRDASVWGGNLASALHTTYYFFTKGTFVALTPRSPVTAIRMRRSWLKPPVIPRPPKLFQNRRHRQREPPK